MIKMYFDENGNARCGKCNRLLFKRTNNSRISGVEIKCHSCKEINYIDNQKKDDYDLFIEAFSPFVSMGDL